MFSEAVYIPFQIHILLHSSSSSSSTLGSDSSMRSCSILGHLTKTAAFPRTLTFARSRYTQATEVRVSNRQLTVETSRKHGMDRPWDSPAFKRT